MVSISRFSWKFLFEVSISWRERSKVLIVEVVGLVNNSRLLSSSHKTFLNLLSRALFEGKKGGNYVFSDEITVRISGSLG